MDPQLDNIISLCNSVDSTLTDQQQQISDLQAKLAAIPAPIQALPIDVLDELQALTGTSEATGWKQPGNAGDSGGPDPSKTSGTFAMTPGEVAKFSAKGAYPYNNGYWYTKRPGFETASRFMLDFQVQFPTANDLGACHALEFELQQSLNGYLYNMAWQLTAPVWSQTWRLFDKVNRKWIPSTVQNNPVAWQDGKWVRVRAAFLRNQDQSTTHCYLAQNDISQVVNVTQPALQKAEKNYLSLGFQLDTDGKNPPTPYSVNVRRMRVTWS